MLARTSHTITGHANGSAQGASLNFSRHLAESYTKLASYYREHLKASACQQRDDLERLIASLGRAPDPDGPDVSFPEQMAVFRETRQEQQDRDARYEAEKARLDDVVKGLEWLEGGMKTLQPWVLALLDNA